MSLALEIAYICQATFQVLSQCPKISVVYSPKLDSVDFDSGLKGKRAIIKQVYVNLVFSIQWNPSSNSDCVLMVVSISILLVPDYAEVCLCLLWSS